MSTNKDYEFLAEMKMRFEKGRNGDSTQFDFVQQMIDDWMAELWVDQDTGEPRVTPRPAPYKRPPQLPR